MSKISYNWTMKKLLIFFFSLITAITFSQSDKRHKFNPFIRFLKVENLAFQITKNLESDSEKIIVIHDWITHNIKFDVKRWLSFEYSPTPIKKILFKRKAISTDYSRLFHELCKYSKIQSTIIHGYTKNEYFDNQDKCYLDEQDWNAVKLNNEWLLIDACLDAGEIEYYKRTFAGYFIFAFSFGSSDRLVYKPYFTSKPNKKYLLKNGYYFKTDHFPSNPIWQLTSSINSIDNFEKDSSSYFNFFDSTSTNKFKDDFSELQAKDATILLEEKNIQDGFNAFNTNPKNNNRIAYSYYLIAEKTYNQINLNSNDKSKLSNLCDSVSNGITKALIHCDTNTYFLKTQKNELLANNIKKKEIITKQNKILISSTESSIKILNSCLKINLSGRINLKTIQQKNKIYKYKIVKNTSFEKSQYSKKTNLTDSTLYSTRIKKFSDSIQISQRKLKEKFVKLDSIYSMYIKNLEIYSNKSNKNITTSKELCNLRLTFIDDLDYPLRKIKDSLLLQKPKDDSLLIDGVNGALPEYFLSQFNTLKVDFDIYSKYMNSIEVEYCKFKKSNKSSKSIEHEHEEQINNYKINIKKFNSLLKNFNKKFKQIYKLSNAQLKKTKAENHSYLKEQFIEFQMNTIRKSFINHHFKVRINENKILISKCQKLKKKLDKDRKIISK